MDVPLFANITDVMLSFTDRNEYKVCLPKHRLRINYDFFFPFHEFNVLWQIIKHTPPNRREKLSKMC